MPKLAVVGFVVVLAVTVWVLRSTTMSRPEEVAPDSSLEVVVLSDTRTFDDPVARLTRAHVDLCVAESSPAVDIETLEAVPAAQIEQLDEVEGTPPRSAFRFLVRPGLDAPDRDQLHGCLEDVRVRHLRLEVSRMIMTVDGSVEQRRDT